MTGENVLNRFELPGPDGDNKLVLEGSSEISGTVNMPENLDISGELKVTGASSFNADAGKFVTATGDQNIGTRRFTVLMPPITVNMSEVSIFPHIDGKLIGITLILQGDPSGATTTVDFDRFNLSGHVTMASASIAVPGSAEKDSKFDSSPAGAEADFSSNDGVRVTTNNLGDGTDTSAVITFEFLLD